MAKRHTIGALWLNYRKNDKDEKEPYFSGTIDLGILGEVKIGIFKNHYKEKDSQPDYNIVISEPQEA